MSLILEALKKSEAERNLGRAPGLLSPAPRIEAARGGRWPVLLALLAAVALGVGGTWWMLAPEAGAPGGASIAMEDSGGDEAALAPAAEVAPPPAQPAAPTRAVSAGPDRPPAAPPRAEPPTAIDGPAPAAATPGDPAFRSVERESVVLPAGAQLPGAGDAAPAAAARRAPVDPAATMRPLAPTDPATTAAPVAASPAVEPVAAADALPALRDLSADERAALPPLKLSMHVFAEQPAGRFVLIDGRRYTEGMAVTEGLVLHEIRRDGIVLELRGRRFLLPRPG